VAYIGAGAADLLPLNEGNLLITDMSLASVRAGRTNPFEIEKYLEKDVEIHSCSNLHAKVFVFDGKAIIGSSNVSKHSSNSLIETALLTTDSIVVSSARGFVRSLRGERIKRDYIKICKKEYRPPTFTPIKTSVKVAPAHPTLWLQRVDEYKYTPQESKLSRQGRKAAMRAIVDKRASTVNDILYGAKHPLAREAAIGDLVIQTWLERGKLLVYPPARIIRIKSYVRTADKSQNKIIFLEEPKSPRRLSWKRFVEALKNIGITRVGEHINRRINSPEVQHPILGLWA
jgi:hypothetical protein